MAGVILIPPFPSTVEGISCRRHRAVLTLMALPALTAQSARAQDRSSDYRIRREFLTMGDGVSLAVTWWIPKPHAPVERFPALLEPLPYRKEVLEQAVALLGIPRVRLRFTAGAPVATFTSRLGSFGEATESVWPCRTRSFR